MWSKHKKDINKLLIFCLVKNLIRNKRKRAQGDGINSLAYFYKDIRSQ